MLDASRDFHQAGHGNPNRHGIRHHYTGRGAGCNGEVMLASRVSDYGQFDFPHAAVIAVGRQQFGKALAGGVQLIVSQWKPRCNREAVTSARASTEPVYLRQ